MDLQFSKKVEWSGESIEVSLDVHKKTRDVCILKHGYQPRVFSPPLEPRALKANLERNFPKR